MATYEACQTVNYSAMRSKCFVRMGECVEYKSSNDKEECADGDSPAIALTKLNQLMNGYCARSGLRDCSLGTVTLGKTFWSQVADAFATSSKYRDFGPKW